VIDVTTWMLAACLLVGCSSAPTAPDPVSVSGTWEASFEGVVQGAGTTQHDDLTMELTQSGTAVSGVLRFGLESIEAPITGGRINGSLLTYSAVVLLRPKCEARVDAEVTVNASATRLEGSQTQSTCEGTAVGRVTATKRR